MAGYLPAPPQLFGAFEGDAPVSLGRAVTLSAGVGVYGRTDEAGVLRIDADTADAARVWSLFAPGTLAAGTIATFRSARPDGQTFLRLLEVNHKTAPAAGTTSTDHLRLRVAGSVSGSIDLPLSTAGTTRFAIDNSTPTPSITCASTVSDVAINTWKTARGAAKLIVPTATTKVRTLTFDPLSQFPIVESAWTEGVTARAAILDADTRQPLSGAVAESQEGARYNAPSGGSQTLKQRNTLALPVELTLTQGVPYYVALWLPEPLGHLRPSPGGAVVGHTQATRNTSNPGGHPDFLLMQNGARAGALFADTLTVAGSPSVSGTPDDTGDGIHASYTSGSSVMAFSLSGIPLGARFSGDLTFSLVTQGTGGVPGADLNIRCEVS